MVSSIRLLGATALLFASVAAHAVDDTYEFESLSRVEHVSGNTNLTGVIVGSTSPTELVVPPATSSTVFDRCPKYYDLMVERPGDFTLSVTIRTVTETGPGGFPFTSVSLLKCSITRNP